MFKQYVIMKVSKTILKRIFDKLSPPFTVEDKTVLVNAIGDAATESEGSTPVVEGTLLKFVHNGQTETDNIEKQ